MNRIWCIEDPFEPVETTGINPKDDSANDAIRPQDYFYEIPILAAK